jgi:hypothetical protein
MCLVLLTLWNKNKLLHLPHLSSKDYGTDNAPIAHPSEITIYDSIYLNSLMHWIFDISQLGGISHPGDRSQGQWSTATSSPGPSWMLDYEGGEDLD